MNLKQNLFTEYRPLYSSSAERPSVIRINMQMRDAVNYDSIRYAVDKTMRRYPYFCVELKNEENNRWVFADNKRPVVITNSLCGVELNSEKSNYHMLSFSWQDDRIIMDVFHGLTDGKGAYEIIRTFLYYYCSRRYGITMSGEGVRLDGDFISAEEWDDPVLKAKDLPSPSRKTMTDALNPVTAAHLKEETEETVYGITLDEKEFMRFTSENNGSPATMISLLLNRAVTRLYPDCTDSIRVTLTVNQRPALRAPLAHQSLVGGAFLEHTDEIKSLPLNKQAAAYRKMVFEQTTEQAILTGVASQKGISQLLLSKATDGERTGIAKMLGDTTSRFVTANVSYVGKADFKEAERYIRDFRLVTSGAGTALLLEISAVNGKFTIEFVQPFSSGLYVSAFLEELEQNGITYGLQKAEKLELPNVRLPWSKLE